MLVKADFRDTVVREVFGHLRARIDRGQRQIEVVEKFLRLIKRVLGTVRARRSRCISIPAVNAPYKR